MTSTKIKQYKASLGKIFYPKKIPGNPYIFNIKLIFHKIVKQFVCFHIQIIGLTLFFLIKINSQ